MVILSFDYCSFLLSEHLAAYSYVRVNIVYSKFDVCFILVVESVHFFHLFNSIVFIDLFSLCNNFSTFFGSFVTLFNFFSVCCYIFRRIVASLSLF